MARESSFLISIQIVFPYKFNFWTFHASLHSLDCKTDRQKWQNRQTEGVISSRRCQHLKENASRIDTTCLHQAPIIPSKKRRHCNYKSIAVKYAWRVMIILRLGFIRSYYLGDSSIHRLYLVNLREWNDFVNNHSKESFWKFLLRHGVFRVNW